MDDLHTAPLPETPLQVFDSRGASVSYLVYPTSIELIRVLRNRDGEPSVVSEHKLHVLRGLQTCYLWDELLFFSDLDSIYLCFPVMFGKEPMKIKLATTFPYSSEEHLKPAGVNYFLGVIDQKVLVVNPTLDFTPISLTDTYLTYYFRLKAGNTKNAFEETRDLPNHEQEIVVRIALYFKQFKLALLYRSIGAVLLQEYSSILQLIKTEPQEVQTEYLTMLGRLMTQATPTQRENIKHSILQHQEVFRLNPRLYEMLAALQQ